MKKLLLVFALLGVLCGSASAWPTWTGTATITAATDNNTSSAVSVPRECKTSLGVFIPTITSGTVAVHASNDGTTYAAYNVDNAATTAAFVTPSGTHNAFYELPRSLLVHKYFRFETSAEQTANRIFTVTCH